MLRRGYTTTSLSVPSQQSADDCLHHAMESLTAQGLELYLSDLGSVFPILKQMTIGRRCVTGASKPLSHDSCKDSFSLQLHFGCLLSKGVKVCPSSSPAQPTRSA